MTSRLKDSCVRSGVLLAVVALLFALPHCSSTAGSSSGCASGELACGNVCCPDAVHYGCDRGACVLTGCDTGLQLCGPGCIPVTADCCDPQAGNYCQTGTVCCGSSCIPIGTSCCGGGRYCPVGRVCCGNGQCC